MVLYRMTFTLGQPEVPRHRTKIIPFILTELCDGQFPFSSFACFSQIEGHVLEK